MASATDGTFHKWVKWRISCSVCFTTIKEEKLSRQLYAGLGQMFSDREANKPKNAVNVLLPGASVSKSQGLGGLRTDWPGRRGQKQGVCRVVAF